MLSAEFTNNKEPAGEIREAFLFVSSSWLDGTRFDFARDRLKDSARDDKQIRWMNADW